MRFTYLLAFVALFIPAYALPIAEPVDTSEENGLNHLPPDWRRGNVDDMIEENGLNRLPPDWRRGNANQRREVEEESNSDSSGFNPDWKRGSADLKRKEDSTDFNPDWRREEADETANSNSLLFSPDWKRDWRHESLNERKSSAWKRSEVDVRRRRDRGSVAGSE